MEYVITKWDEMRILQQASIVQLVSCMNDCAGNNGSCPQVADHKLIFLETKDVVETTLALDNYKRACDCGRCIYLCIFRDFLLLLLL